MTFSGYSEELRGNWFGGGTKMLYIDNAEGSEFFIINEQDSHLIRVTDEKQIELLELCMYGPQVQREQIYWLISVNGGGFKYFESVEAFKIHCEKVLEEIKNEG